VQDLRSNVFALRRPHEREPSAGSTASAATETTGRTGSRVDRRAGVLWRHPTPDAFAAFRRTTGKVGVDPATFREPERAVRRRRARSPGRTSSSRAPSATRPSGREKNLCASTLRHGPPCAGGFDTIKEPWPHPLESGGGGRALVSRLPSTTHGRLYAGHLDPTPLGAARPPGRNGAAFPGAVAVHRLIARARRPQPAGLLWARPGGRRTERSADYDFQATPDSHAGWATQTSCSGGGGRPGRGDRVVDRPGRSSGSGAASVVMQPQRQRGRCPATTPRDGLPPASSAASRRRWAYARCGAALRPRSVDLCGWGSADRASGGDEHRPDTRKRGRSSRSTARDPGARSGGGRFCRHPTSGLRERWRTTFVFTATFDGTVLRASQPRERARSSGRVRIGARASIRAPCTIVGDLLVVGARRSPCGRSDAGARRRSAYPEDRGRLKSRRRLKVVSDVTRIFVRLVAQRHHPVVEGAALCLPVRRLLDDGLRARPSGRRPEHAPAGGCRRRRTCLPRPGLCSRRSEVPGGQSALRSQAAVEGRRPANQFPDRAEREVGQFQP